MKVCVVASCRKDSVRFPGVTFFNLPKDPCAKGEWLDALGLKYSEASQNIKVCEIHFKPKDFCASKKQLKTHALPVLNLGIGKVETFDSDDEFMNCNSDNDEDLLEAKRLTAAAAMMESKIKEEPPEEKPEPEQEPETGRRPSRRAAREAAKKIYNTVRNYGCAPDTDEPEEIGSITRSTSAASRNVSSASRNASSARNTSSATRNTSSRSNQRQRSRPPALKVPPPNIDLIMECHEELLSTIQAEALLQAQLQYNMVMKTLRSLKANNVRIICASADDPVSVEDTNGSVVSNNKESNDSQVKSPNIVTLQAVKKDGAPVPMELSTSVPSPGPSILS